MAPDQLIWLISAALFLCGLGALILRRQLIAMLLGLELMINAANLNLAFFGRQWSDPGGWACVLWVLAAAAAEVAVGLTLILAFSRVAQTETGKMTELEG